MQAGVVGSVDTGMVVGGGKHRRHMAHLKLWCVVLLCLVVMGGAGCGVYHWRHMSKQPQKTVSSSKPQQKSSEPPDGFADFTPSQKAEYYIGVKNYTAAQQVYETELKTAATSTDKANIYISLGTDALNAKNYEQAYRYGVQADTTAPGYPTAQFTAYAAQMAGDKKDATQYYQLAITRLDKSSSDYEFVLGQLQQSLQEVSK